MSDVVLTRIAQLPAVTAAEVEATAKIPIDNGTTTKALTVAELQSLTSGDFATSTEIAVAISAHEQSSDPHSQYATDLDLTSGLATKATPADISTAINAHESALNPHPQYASADQGNLADTALQPSTIGSTLQGFDADLQAIASLAPSQDQLLVRGSTAWEARALTSSDIPNLDAAKITSGKFSSDRIPDLSATYQPLDADLTAIAVLTTTSYGRSFLTQANAAAARLLSWGLDIQIGSVKPTTRSDGSALVSGDRWLDTSDRIWFYWNGIYWLSDQIYKIIGGTTLQLSSNTFIPLDAISGTWNIFITATTFSGETVGTTYNASDKWIFNFRRRSIGGSGWVVLTAPELNAGSASAGFRVTSSPNLHVDVTATSTAQIDVFVQKNNLPSDIRYVNVALFYRLAKP